MTKAELIEALHGGAEFLEHSTPGIKNSFAKMCHDAADALEAAEKRIAELEESNKMLKNAIDVDKGVMLDRICYLEARLPKEGEWNIRETASGDLEAKCPRCGFEMLVNQPGNGLLMVSELFYCPHCGSRMTKREQE